MISAGHRLRNDTTPPQADLDWWLAPVCADVPWSVGDSCGCPDDRCRGFHHYAGDTCWCTDALLLAWLVALNGGQDSIFAAWSAVVDLAQRLDTGLTILEEQVGDSADSAAADRLVDAEIALLAADLEAGGLWREYVQVTRLRARVFDAIYANTGSAP